MNAEKNVFFYGILCDFLEFPSVNLPKVSQHMASSQIRNFNTNHVGFLLRHFFRFFQIYILYRCQKSGLRLKIFITSLPNFTEFYRRKREKIHSQPCFLCSCWRDKISKTLTFSFDRAQIAWVFVHSQGAIVKLKRAALIQFNIT